MNFPENLKYTKDHEWVRVENNIAIVGITDFAQSELGDIVYVEIETQGETLEKEAIFGTIEAVKTVSDLFMPVSGKVLSINEMISSKPESLNTDPYGNAWMIRIEMSKPSELNDLMSSADYRQMVGANA